MKVRNEVKKAVLLAVAISGILVLCSCGGHMENAPRFNSKRGSVYIDTIVIHDKPHEILIYSYYKSGSICHSPECWCINGDKK